MLVVLHLGLEGGRAGWALQLDGTFTIAMPLNQVGVPQTLSTSTLAEEGKHSWIAEGENGEINEQKKSISPPASLFLVTLQIVTPAYSLATHVTLLLGRLLVMRLEVPRKMLLIAPFQALRANTDLLSRGEVHLNNICRFC